MRKRREETAGKRIRRSNTNRLIPRDRRGFRNRRADSLTIQTKPIANKKLGRIETDTAQQDTEAANVRLDSRPLVPLCDKRKSPASPRHPAARSICAGPPGITVADQNKKHPNATASFRCRIREGMPSRVDVKRSADQTKRRHIRKEKIIHGIMLRSRALGKKRHWRRGSLSLYSISQVSSPERRREAK